MYFVGHFEVRRFVGVTFGVGHFWGETLWLCAIFVARPITKRFFAKFVIFTNFFLNFYKISTFWQYFGQF